MAISQKKRFNILSRDNHQCVYCGRKPPYVMLEVDHIIAKSKGGSDIMTNLVTSCFDCNRGKGSDEKDNNGNTYKMKIKDNAMKAKNYFQYQWNKSYMGIIDKNTYILLMMYINHHLVDFDVYKTRVDFPPCLPGDRLYSQQELDILFKTGGMFCDKILDVMYEEIIPGLDEILEIVFVTDNRKWYKEEDYNNKLNYRLTNYLEELYEGKKYILKKFTLHPKLLG